MLIFYFNFIERDLNLAQRLVNQLNIHHPESKIIAISDGYVGKSLLGNNLAIYNERHLKREFCLGLFTSRNFNIILKECDASSTWIIKLDPDCYFQKPIKELPQVDSGDWGGYKINQELFDWGYSSWVKGSSFIIKREAIAKIVDSNLLLHPRYLYFGPKEKSYRAYPYEDCRLGHVANELGIKKFIWKQIRIFDQPISEKEARETTVKSPILVPVN